MPDKIGDMIELGGRTAVVAGGGGYIGSSVAAALAELGAGVGLLDQDEAKCLDAASRLRERYDAPVEPMIVDLRDEAAVRDVPDRAQAALGGLDILVHCAALTGGSDLPGYSVPFEEQSSSAWREALEVNLTSAFNLAQAAAPLLAESRHAAIVHVASIYGVAGPVPELYAGLEIDNPAAYAASKGGMVQLTRWLATTLAPDVRVNAVSPGGVARDQPEEFRRRYQARTPLRRMAREEDVAAAVVYLASDMARYVTGQNLLVDGGWTVW